MRAAALSLTGFPRMPNPIFDSERIAPFTAGVNRVNSDEKPPCYYWLRVSNVAG
jgi:hypothetical protein